MQPYILCNGLDPKTEHQFYEAINQPFVTKAALLPDAHLGYDAPIGSVIETKGIVCPSWVGYDIGCGVEAICMTLTRDDITEHLPTISDLLRVHLSDRENRRMNKSADRIMGMLTEKGKDIFWDRKGSYQLGTIGSGNHFVDLSYSDRTGSLYCVIHSGSRGFGHGVGEYYMSNFDKFLDKDSPEAKDYFKDSFGATMFAHHSRNEMFMIVKSVLEDVVGRTVFVDEERTARRNHNAYQLTLDGSGVIHRKGTIHSYKGCLCPIPGNMAYGTVLVRGLGNPDTLESCSHGAGRSKSRGEAKRSVDPEVFEQQMKGIIVPGELSTFADENPEGYKDMLEVMGQQYNTTCTFTDHLIPLVVIKGK